MQEHIFEDRIYYRTNIFETNRLTLVFIHGVSGSSSAWLPYEKIFEKKYNILNYDIRGHGKSKKYPRYEDYEIKNFAIDLHDLLIHLKIRRFILISNSFAALVALEYIKLWRETVVASIFTSPEIYLEEGFSVKFMRFVVKILAGILSFLPFKAEPRGHVEYSKHIGSTDWDIKRNLADIRNTGLHAHFFTLKQSLYSSHEFNLKEINIPTLIIHGERDSMVPLKNAKMMSGQIKNSQFVSIPDVDHNTVHNGAKEISQAIESFIENKNLLQ